MQYIVVRIYVPLLPEYHFICDYETICWDEMGFVLIRAQLASGL